MCKHSILADLEARCQQTVTHGLNFGLPPVFVKKKKKLKQTSSLVYILSSSVFKLQRQCLLTFDLDNSLDDPQLKSRYNRLVLLKRDISELMLSACYVAYIFIRALCELI